MKIFRISNVRRFFEKVASCTGGVYATDADGNQQDYKALAEYLIQCGMAGSIASIPEVDLKVEKPSDVRMLLEYMVQMA